MTSEPDRHEAVLLDKEPRLLSEDIPHSSIDYVVSHF